MKKVTLYITTCFMCPYYEQLKNHKVEANLCTYEGLRLRLIPEIRDEIPPWCQLKEVKK